MEMDLVAHCGEANRASYVNSLVLTDIASGWAEAAPLVVRESGLLVETLDRVRQGLPFALRAPDVDNSGALDPLKLLEENAPSKRIWPHWPIGSHFPAQHGNRPIFRPL